MFPSNVGRNGTGAGVRRGLGTRSKGWAHRPRRDRVSGIPQAPHTGSHLNQDWAFKTTLPAPSTAVIGPHFDPLGGAENGGGPLGELRRTRQTLCSRGCFVVEASASTSDSWGDFTPQTGSSSLRRGCGSTFFKVPSPSVLQVQLIQRSSTGQRQEDGSWLRLVLTLTREGTPYEPRSISGSLPSCLEAGLTCDAPVQ